MNSLRWGVPCQWLMTAAWHKGSIAEAGGTNVGEGLGGSLGLVGMCIRGGLGCRVETHQEGKREKRQKNHRRHVMAPRHLPTMDASSDRASKVCTTENWMTRACQVVGQGRMQQARQKHTDACVAGHGQRNVAAAWERGLGVECCRSELPQKWSLDLEIGMHAAHEEQVHSGIKMNPLPRYRRLVERKPHRRLF